MNKCSPIHVFPSALIVVLLSASIITAGNHYVRPPGTTTTVAFPYDTWDKAATNIQQAVDAAMASLPATVWVTNGAYCVTGQVVVTTSVVVRSVSGWTNTTVYSDFPAYTSRCFFLAHGAILDGFTVSNGHDYTPMGGGGIYAISNVIVRNCRLVTNVSDYAVGYSGANGGGISADKGSIVSNCLVMGNWAIQSWQGGGGIRVGENSWAVNCIVVSNYRPGSGYGGGIYASSASAVVSNCYVAFNSCANGAGIFTLGLVTDCIVSNNSGNWGGVADGGGALSAIIRNTRIVNNSGYSGAGFCASYGSAAQPVILTNCFISGNSGPGLWLDAAVLNVRVNNCVITGNRNSGIFIRRAGRIIIDSCQISNNVASGNYHDSSVDYPPGGGGIFMANGYVCNCLIHHNTNLSIGFGGGISMTNAAGSTNPSGVVNCLIADNYSTNEGGGVALFGESNLLVNCVIASNRSWAGVYPDVYATLSNSNNFWHCCANAPAYPLPPAQGNITNAPMFADAAYRLSVNSPCVNAGLNQAWMTNGVDMDGNKRIFYKTVDMGPYEKIYSGTVFGFK